MALGPAGEARRSVRPARASRGWLGASKLPGTWKASQPSGVSRPTRSGSRARCSGHPLQGRVADDHVDRLVRLPVPEVTDAGRRTRSVGVLWRPLDHLGRGVDAGDRRARPALRPARRSAGPGRSPGRPPVAGAVGADPGDQVEERSGPLVGELQVRLWIPDRHRSPRSLDIKILTGLSDHRVGFGHDDHRAPADPDRDRRTGRCPPTCGGPPRAPDPGLVLVQEIFGVTDYIRQRAADLAALGYVVCAPEVYWRLDQAGIDVSRDDVLEQAMGLASQIDWPAAVADVSLAVSHCAACSRSTGEWAWSASASAAVWPSTWPR